MKGTLEPSAPSIIPNPCASIFFTIPVILSVLPVQPCSRSASRSAIGWARNFSIHCSFPLAAFAECKIWGCNPGFYERAQTLVVNAHGALMALAEKVTPKQRLLMQNIDTGEQKEAAWSTWRRSWRDRLRLQWNSHGPHRAFGASRIRPPIGPPALRSNRTQQRNRNHS